MALNDVVIRDKRLERAFEALAGLRVTDFEAGLDPCLVFENGARLSVTPDGDLVVRRP